MADYPDWIRAFNLVGTEITIPINIEASDVTLPVSINASTVELDCLFVGQTVTMLMRVTSCAVTLNVNIAAQEANIDFNFADQSVAVFDAAKWFAHEAAQVFVLGNATPASGSFATIASRVVPDGTVYFITFVSVGYNGATNANVGAYFDAGGSDVIRLGGVNGVQTIFDTPIRAVGPIVVQLYAGQWSGGAAQIMGGFGGYDEVS